MPRSRPFRLAITIAALLLSLAWVWRFQLGNGFTHTFGDRNDAMIEIALLEHWSNVLAGAEAWNGVAWFHPALGTLGYNDGYLVFGLVHALGRSLGLSTFAATDLAHAALKAAGFVGMALLLRRAGGVQPDWALFGATLFTVADLTISHANHGQLFTLGFGPWAALAGWATARAVVDRDQKRALRCGLAFAAVFALWISTAYYLAWFFALYLLVLGIFVLASGGALRPLLASWKPLLAVGLAAVVLLVPFLVVYLPKASETGMHDPRIALRTTLWPIDLINTGPANLLWGWLPQAIRASFAPGLTSDPDAVFGMPPLFLAAAIAAILWAQRSGDRWLARVGAALLVCWVLMLNLGGIIPWRAVQVIVPGAGGIRVVGRFAILLLLPAIFLLTVALDRLKRGAPLLAAALLVEQVATAAPVALDVAERTRALAAIPPPPLACRSFAVIHATDTPERDPVYAGNVDAMVLASLWRRPTINGVSTFGPPGWNFARTTAPDYPARVRGYARRFGLRDVCLLDTRRAHPWSKLG